MTVIIISVLLVLFLLGLLIPQKKYYPSQNDYSRWKASNPISSGLIEYLKLNEIYLAPVTVFSLGLFFLNLLVVVAHRVPTVLRRAYITGQAGALINVPRIKKDTSAGRIIAAYNTGGSGRDIGEKAAAFFRRKNWSVIVAGSSPSFIALKNRYSPLGFLLFHVSFLLCLAGGLLVMYTRFSGHLILGEGQEFHSDIRQFASINSDPKIFKALPDLGITLLKVFPGYEGSVGTDLSVEMRVKYFSETFESVAKINEPLKKGAISILPSNVGVSPLFILKEKGGKELDGGYIILNILKGDEDSFEFPGFPYRIYVSFYPDFYEQDGKPATKSLALNNPVLKLRIEDKGKVLYDAYRRLNEPLFFGEYQLVCSELRYWVDFLIIREYGTTLLFSGFLFGVAGLLMRLIFYQKTIKAHVEVGPDDGQCTLYISGNSEYYPEAFRDEMGRLSEALSGEFEIIRKEELPDGLD